MDTERRYRPQRSYLRTAILCTVAFCLFDFGSVFVAVTNFDGSFARPQLAAIVFGLFWTTWVVLGVLMLLIALRHELVLSQNSISQTGAFRRKRMHFDELHSARWRRWPQGGSLVLRSSVERIVIEFALFARDERSEIINGFRSRINSEKQVGWDRFNLIAKPITPAKSTLPLRIIVPGTFVCIAAFFALQAFSRSRNEFYVFAALNVACAGWNAYSLRPDKHREAGPKE